MTPVSLSRARLPEPSLADDLTLITEAALEGGRLAMRLREAGLKVSGKAGGSPVTNGDLAVDRLLTERLRTARPDYGWLSEETADNAERLSAQRVFIVDPIDGTTAYFKALPWFTVAIAVVEEGRATAGVVHAPALSDTYAAVLGGGATLNGEAISASGTAELEGASMLAPLDTFNDPRWRTPWPPMRVEKRNAITLRMALVAAGAFDAAVSLGPKHDWDLAAGTIIAEEAGAVVSDRMGERLRFNTARASSRSLVCAGPKLHALIAERVAAIDIGD